MLSQSKDVAPHQMWLCHCASSDNNSATCKPNSLALQAEPTSQVLLFEVGFVQTQQMALHQIALTKVHLCAWKRRDGGGAGLELLLGSLAQSEKVQCNLPSKTGKTFLVLLPAGQRTPPLWACWQWHPRESTETATGQWLLRAPLAVLWDLAPPEQAHGSTHSYGGSTLELLLLPWILPSLSKTKGKCQSEWALGHLCPSRAGAAPTQGKEERSQVSTVLTGALEGLGNSSN